MHPTEQIKLQILCSIKDRKWSWHTEHPGHSSGIRHPGRVKLVEEFIRYAQKQKGVVFMRKDEVAKWALSAPNVPHEA